MQHIWEAIAIFNDIEWSENKTGLQKKKIPWELPVFHRFTINMIKKHNMTESESL